MSYINKVLVANRGEIACRVIKTAKKYSIIIILIEWELKRLLFIVISIKIPNLFRCLTKHIMLDQLQHVINNKLNNILKCNPI